VQSLLQFNSFELRDLAEILKALMSAYDKLFGLSFPYMMAMHQKPTENTSCDYYHFHVEFYPPMRSANRTEIPGRQRERVPECILTIPFQSLRQAELRSHVSSVYGARRN
jgi:UDPglucose--hexose-1-phosphate uridylyltransferase